jgi:outer membrane lipoprotein-sorting protein
MASRLRILLLLATLLLPTMLAAQSDDLLARIWEGVQQAQNHTQSACGSVTETRTSALMTRPMILHGKFCAQGMTRFMLEYSEPAVMRIRYAGDTLNITAGGHTEIMEIGDSVRRAQSSFSRANSIQTLKKNFTITAEDDGRAFVLRFVPRSQAFRGRLNLLMVKLGKRDFLPQLIEVDGKSGVNSVFSIDVTSTNRKISPETFQVETRP